MLLARRLLIRPRRVLMFPTPFAGCRRSADLRPWACRRSIRTLGDLPQSVELQRTPDSQLNSQLKPKLTTQLTTQQSKEQLHPGQNTAAYPTDSKEKENKKKAQLKAEGNVVEPKTE